MARVRSFDLGCSMTVIRCSGRFRRRCECQGKAKAGSADVTAVAYFTFWSCQIAGGGNREREILAQAQNLERWWYGSFKGKRCQDPFYDGVFPYLLAVRDLASHQLAIEPPLNSRHRHCADRVSLQPRVRPILPLRTVLQVYQSPCQ
jgi:hypothetical protein